MPIKWVKPETNKIFLNKETLTENIPKRLILHFGAWEKAMDIKIDNHLPKHTIGLPENLTNDFKIPTNLPYEIYMDKHHIYLGPVIAFLPYAKKSSLTLSNLRQLKDRFLQYSKINGLIYVCAKEMINIADKTIEGYYYNPNGTDEKSQWIYGVFPYPAAVFKRGWFGLGEKTYNSLYENIGDKIFNTIYNISKWKLWSMLSPYDSIKKHLPHTEQLKDVHSLDRMLNLYGYVYLKPYNLLKGRGVITVHKSKEGYHFIDRFKNETKIIDRDCLIDYLNEILTRKYIIQQAVPYKYKNRNLDFRLYLQKNKHKEWNCPGITTRISKEGSIVTGLAHQEYLLMSHDAFKKIYHLDDKAILQKESEMINICIKACKAVEKHVKHIGDVAIDLIVDENLRVWILEIQVSYGSEPIQKLAPEVHEKILTTPFEYAKTLAGF